MHPKRLTTSEAATVMGVSAGTVRRWAKTGRLKHVIMPSGHIRFTEHELLAAMRHVDLDDAVEQVTRIKRPA